MMLTKGVQFPMEITYVLFGVIIVWIVILTVAVFRMVAHYNRLTVGVTSHTLRDALEKILDEHMKNRKDVKELERIFLRLEEEGQYHMQRVGIVRFNPFSDTGGSQSFTMAILDKRDNGIVLTSLYARTGNRWYIKHVVKGKGEGMELSREEETAIREAKRVA
jgi:hypothetical protein